MTIKEIDKPVPACSQLRAHCVRKMTIFDYARDEGLPSQYGPNRTPVTVDVLEAGFILAAVILAVSFFVSIITARTHQNICLYIRITLSILIGVLILLGNFGQEWEVGQIKSHTYYKAGSGDEIYAKIGLKIGLRSVNVTLKSVGNQSHSFVNETINYNERFHWTWDQGRFGFGPYAGLLQREFRKAQYRGAPLPILWIVDYFVIDGEGFRYGRFYRTAGWYSHIAMWSAFPCWLLANIFFRSVVRYGGYLLGIAGCLQLTANLLWLVIRNPNPLVIPFKDATMYTHFGSTYWLTFSSGLLCVILSIVITICEYVCHGQLHIFFGLDPLTNSDEKYLTLEEVEAELKKQPTYVNLVDTEANMRDRISKPTDRGKTMMIRVRKNSNSVLRMSMMNNTQIYGNLRNVRQPIPIVEEAEVQATYDSVSNADAGPSGITQEAEEPTTNDDVSLLNPIQRRPLPPIPPRKRRV